MANKLRYIISYIDLTIITVLKRGVFFFAFYKVSTNLNRNDVTS